MPDQVDARAELYELLPHRPPILLVDRIDGGEPGSWIETVTAISGDEPCYAGLPESKTQAYPAVLLLESFVQSAAVLWARTARADGKPPQGTLVFAGAKDVGFHRPVFPGDSLRHRVRLAGQVGSNAFLTGESVLDATGETVLTVGSIAVGVRPAGFLERLAGPTGPLGPVRR